MSHFRRWTAGVVSRVDWLVTRVENHEALADSTLLDMRRALARAQARMARVERDGEALRREEASRRADVERWRERARTEEDQERALECLHRARIASVRAEELGRQLAEHERFETRQREDIRRQRERLDELLRRRNRMRTRASRARAASALHEHGGVELDDVFERWEESLCEKEVDLGPAHDEPEAPDPFEAHYVAEEERAELERELSDLREERS